MTCYSCGTVDWCDEIQNTNLNDISTEMMRLTNERGVEHGIFVTEKGGSLWTTPIQRGENHGIVIEYNEGSPIGTIHTHPTERFESLFSLQDMKSMIDGDLQFSAAIFDEGGVAVADVFEPTGYSSFKELESSLYEQGDTNIELSRRMNEDLHSCKIELGEL